MEEIANQSARSTLEAMQRRLALHREDSALPSFNNRETKTFLASSGSISIIF